MTSSNDPPPASQQEDVVETIHHLILKPPLKTRDRATISILQKYTEEKTVSLATIIFILALPIENAYWKDDITYPSLDLFSVILYYARSLTMVSMEVRNEIHARLMDVIVALLERDEPEGPEGGGWIDGSVGERFWRDWVFGGEGVRGEWMGRGQEMCEEGGEMGRQWGNLNAFIVGLVRRGVLDFEDLGVEVWEGGLDWLKRERDDERLEGVLEGMEAWIEVLGEKGKEREGKMGDGNWRGWIESLGRLCEGEGEWGEETREKAGRMRARMEYFLGE